MKTNLANPLRIRRTTDGKLLVVWSDEHKTAIKIRDLRLACPCAVCVDEFTGEALLDPKTISSQIAIQRVNTVGRYALHFHFSDSHQTGIYTWDLLQKIGQHQS